MLYKKLLKRLFDAFFALILCLMTLPAIVLACLLVRLESKGSPLFQQTRVGQGGKTFTIFKIRTMVVNASDLGSHATLTNDQRITKMGKILRATSFDELPQFWNVLSGDMSFIGPRPDVPQQEKDYAPEDWQKRHLVKPGITGLAQVNGRSACTFQERTQYDLDYAQKVSFALDVKIVLKTIGIVLGAKGAT